MRGHVTSTQRSSKLQVQARISGCARKTCIKSERSKWFRAGSTIGGALVATRICAVTVEDNASKSPKSRGKANRRCANLTESYDISVSGVDAALSSITPQ